MQVSLLDYEVSQHRRKKIRKIGNRRHWNLPGITV